MSSRAGNIRIRRIHLLLAVIIALVALVPWKDVAAELRHTPHEDPNRAQESISSPIYLLLYADALEKLVSGDYDSATELLEEIENVPLPQELQASLERYSDLLLKLRHRRQQDPPPGGRWEGLAYGAWARVVKWPAAFGWASWLATRTLGRWRRKSGWLRRLPGKLHGWTRSRDFPAPASERFRDWWSRDASAAEDETERPREQP